MGANIDEESSEDNLPLKEEYKPAESAMTPEQIRCHEAAEKYIRNCLHFQMKVDPSVVIALRTGWDVLQPSRQFTEGSMLPLMDILEDNNQIHKVNFSHVGMQDSRYVSVLFLSYISFSRHLFMFA
jgi:hypothetical protein